MFLEDKRAFYRTIMIGIIGKRETQLNSYTASSSEVQTNRRSIFALLALAISAFGIGTTEFVSVGLLPSISEDLHVSVTTAGLTVSLYALGVAFGAPVLTSLTANMSRKTLLMWIMIIFIIGNGIAAVATSFTVLLIARIISALSHGVFMSIGSTIAAALSQKINGLARLRLCLLV